MNRNYLKIAAFLTLGIFLTSCNPEDGADGINGIDGINGTDGADGENGLGFDELTKYGSITSTLTGTRPDDVPFTQTDTYKFTAVEAEEIADYNSVTFNENETEFNLLRFISTPDDIFQRNTIGINLKVIDTVGINVFEFDIDFDENIIIGDDLKFFDFENNYSEDDEGVTNFSITNYSFNDITNALSFSYSFNVDAANNDSRNDISISGQVDVIVLEEIN